MPVPELGQQPSVSAWREEVGRTHGDAVDLHCAFCDVEMLIWELEMVMAIGNGEYLEERCGSLSSSEVGEDHEMVLPVFNRVVMEDCSVDT